MVKLVALDLDGTTLDSRLAISRENICAVQKRERRRCCHRNWAMHSRRHRGDSLVLIFPLPANGALVMMSATGPEVLRVPVPAGERGHRPVAGGGA